MAAVQQAGAEGIPGADAADAADASDEGLSRITNSDLANLISDRDMLTLLREELAKAGFAVVDENIRSQWNPEKEDLDKSEAIVKALLA